MKRIMADEAMEFFADQSQQRGGMISPDQLHDNGIEYWADGPICGVFHQAHWPGVWMGHYGVKPEGFGGLVEPAKRVLRGFWKVKRPELIIGWTKESNRAALAFARRIGFVEHGRMVLPDGAVIMQEWRP